MADKDVVKILQGLQQAAANAYDGAADYEGKTDKKDKIGLKREEGSYLDGNRLLDNFNIKLQDNKMVLNYHAEVLMKEVHDKKFKDNIESTMADVIKWLKREYKKVTGESITLKPKGKPSIRVESTSRIRTFVLAQGVYEVGGVPKGGEPKRTVDKAIKDWLSQGKSKSEGFK